MLPRPTTHSKALGPGVAGPELAVATSAVLDRPPQPTAQRPLSGAQAFSVDPSLVESTDGPRQHTQYPYVTGTSVLAIKYAGGVMLAADTLGAYGSTKRYKSLDRIVRVNARTLVGAGGEVSDFQYILRLLDELATDDYRVDDGIELGPKQVMGGVSGVAGAGLGAGRGPARGRGAAGQRAWVGAGACGDVCLRSHNHGRVASHGACASVRASRARFHAPQLTLSKRRAQQHCSTPSRSTPSRLPGTGGCLAPGCQAAAASPHPLAPSRPLPRARPRTPRRVGTHPARRPSSPVPPLPPSLHPSPPPTPRSTRTSRG
jgi:hypothetical protein